MEDYKRIVRKTINKTNNTYLLQENYKIVKELENKSNILNKCYMQVVNLQIKTSITQTQLHKSSNYRSTLCSSMVEETAEISTTY